MSDLTQIGIYELTEPMEVRKSYETASWYKTVEVPAGVYPVMAEVQDGKVVDFPGPRVAFTGTVTDAYFPSGFGGHYQYTETQAGKDQDKVGKPETAHIRWYAHALAWELLRGGSTRVTLSAGYEARVVDFISSVDGEPKQTAGLFVR